MANFMSDTERDSAYRLAIDYIKQAQEMNRQVRKLRKNADRDGKTFGSTGTEMDSLLSDAATLDALAQAVLASIDDNAQPIADQSDASMAISIDESLEEITLVAADADYTDFPTSGTFQITGSTVGNNNTYTLSSRTAGVLTASGTPSLAADESSTTSPSLKLTWLTY